MKTYRALDTDKIIETLHRCTSASSSASRARASSACARSSLAIAKQTARARRAIARVCDMWLHGYAGRWRDRRASASTCCRSGRSLRAVRQLAGVLQGLEAAVNLAISRRRAAFFLTTLEAR